MANNKRSIARRAIPGLVAFLMGAPLAAARADQPMTPEQAQVKSMRYGIEAAQLRKLDGEAYKSGQVQRAEAQQAKYAALAGQLSAQPVWTRPNPNAEHYAEVAQHYREMAGGPAYKWRRVSEAEAQQRYYESIEAPPQPLSEFGIQFVETPPTLQDHPSCETVSKPVVAALECAQ
jgi:hypothetical protein